MKHFIYGKETVEVTVDDNHWYFRVYKENGTDMFNITRTKTYGELVQYISIPKHLWYKNEKGKRTLIEGWYEQDGKTLDFWLKKFADKMHGKIPRGISVMSMAKRMEIMENIIFLQ